MLMQRSASADNQHSRISQKLSKNVYFCLIKKSRDPENSEKYGFAYGKKRFFTEKNRKKRKNTFEVFFKYLTMSTSNAC